MPEPAMQVMLPFAALPTTDGVRRAIANVIRDIQRGHEETDQQTADRLGVHVNTVQRARNGQTTLDIVTLGRIGAVYGEDALAPYRALYAGSCLDHGDPLAAAANVMSALTRAKGPKAELDALPVVKDAIETLSAWALETERKRLRIVG